MLFWHKYDVDKASDDLKNFTPLPGMTKFKAANLCTFMIKST